MEVLVVSQVGHRKLWFLIVLTSLSPERMEETVTKIFQAWGCTANQMYNFILWYAAGNCD